MSTLSDSVKVSVTVATDPATAFDAFTKETDLWWRRGLKYRVAGLRPGVLYFEPGLGGRLLESYETATGIQVHEAGRITAWDPPGRFQFEWRGVNFAPGECTEVEVTFEPIPSGTRVTVQHRGWSKLPPGHPVRHGLEGADFLRMIALWWSELMTSLREFL